MFNSKLPMHFKPGEGTTHQIVSEDLLAPRNHVVELIGSVDDAAHQLANDVGRGQLFHPESPRGDSRDYEIERPSGEGDDNRRSDPVP